MVQFIAYIDFKGTLRVDLHEYKGYYDEIEETSYVGKILVYLCILSIDVH